VLTRGVDLSDGEREEFALGHMTQLVEGLLFLHANGVAHRDLKLENLILDADGTLKIADFGMAALFEEDSNEMRTFCGTEQYMAPEVTRTPPPHKRAGHPRRKIRRPCERRLERGGDPLRHARRLLPLRFDRRHPLRPLRVPADLPAPSEGSAPPPPLTAQGWSNKCSAGTPPAASPSPTSRAAHGSARNSPVFLSLSSKVQTQTLGGLPPPRRA
jgi:serine/threonine protein kinase